MRLGNRSERNILAIASIKEKAFILEYIHYQSKAWEYANSRKRYWRISNFWILHKIPTIRYWNSQGFKSFYGYYPKVRVYT